MSDSDGMAEVGFFASKAHCCLAESINRKLLMQALFCAINLDFTKLGIAIAANRPIMATTIMISTNVKPPVDFNCVFITNLFTSSVNPVSGGYDDYMVGSNIA